MREQAEFTVESAGPDDAVVIGQLLHDFNREFNEPSSGPAKLAERISELLGAGDTVALLVRPEPSGIAVLRFRPSIWTPGLACYLAELYVVPARRGEGRGSGLMEAAIP